MGTGELARSIYDVWRSNAWWMGWNLFLALVPLGIGLVLFRARRHTPLWWVGAVTFVAFLPHAPYVVTDVVHLPRDVRAHPDGVVLFGVLPLYVGFIAAGLLAYALALRGLAAHLVRSGWPARRVVVVEMGLHAASAVGIFLGRVLRLNSWDLVVRPAEVLTSAVESTVSLYGIAAIVVTFVVIVPTTTMLRWSVDAAASRAIGLSEHLRLR
jgi:uncharacterized membrane protein